MSALATCRFSSSVPIRLGGFLSINPLSFLCQFQLWFRRFISHQIRKPGFSSLRFFLLASTPYRLPIPNNFQHPAYRSSRRRREAIVMPWPVLHLTGHLKFPIDPHNFATSNYECDKILKHLLIQTSKVFNVSIIIPNHLSTSPYVD